MQFYGFILIVNFVWLILRKQYAHTIRWTHFCIK